MRALELPYPSFTLAMTMIDRSSNRLPTYRSSHLLRFHPYPRVARRHDRDDPLMNTIDYRYIDEFPCDPPSSIFLEPTNANGEDPDGDVSTLDLDFQPARQPCRDKVEKHPLVLPLVIDIARKVKSKYRAIKKLLPPKKD
ncbi:hypothetical protein AcW1_009859 [Taiwanofungus camphoratus]|nr:hypothetical protein AcV7_007004 [Antrodia cinnamomea]KAI0946384.1 hypothetical protein AcW1_009859 [Antrodia cinnamomea]